MHDKQIPMRLRPVWGIKSVLSQAIYFRKMKRVASHKEYPLPFFGKKLIMRNK